MVFAITIVIIQRQLILTFFFVKPYADNVPSDNSSDDSEKEEESENKALKFHNNMQL